MEIIALVFAIQSVIKYPYKLGPLYPDSASEPQWESCSPEER
jgi:hypothetical protein